MVETVAWMILLSYGFIGSRVTLRPLRTTLRARRLASDSSVFSRFSRKLPLSMVMRM